METKEPDVQHEVSAPSSSPPAADQRAVPEWLIEYLKTSPVSVAWQSALVIGGFILAVHFFHIGFFPDLDWTASLALVAIVALTGLAIWCLISLFLIFPSFTWSVVFEDVGTGEAKSAGGNVKEANTPSDEAGESAVGTESKSGGKSGKAGASGDGLKHAGPKWWGVGVLFGIPALVFWSVIVATIVFDWETVYSNFFLLTGLLVLTIPACGVPAYLLTRGKVALGERFVNISIARYLIAIFAGSLVFIAPILMMYALAYSRYNPLTGKPLIFAVAAFLGFIFNLATFHHWLANTARSTPFGGFFSALLFGTFLFVALIGATRNWVLIPEAVASLYGIGNLDGVTLVLDKEGCAIVGSLHIDKDQEVGAELCSVPRVKILNRLGTTYYVESQGGDEFTLPSTSVRSYERPASYPYDVHVELSEENGFYSWGQISIINTSAEKVADLQADIEFRDKKGRLVGWYRQTFNGHTDGSQQPRGFAVQPPLAVDSTTWRLILSRYGKNVPYILK